jgi:hypothetical protein
MRDPDTFNETRSNRQAAIAMSAAFLAAVIGTGIYKYLDNDKEKIPVAPTSYRPGDVISAFPMPRLANRPIPVTVDQRGVIINYEAANKFYKVLAKKYPQRTITISLDPGEAQNGASVDIKPTGISGGAIDPMGDIYLPTDPNDNSYTLTVETDRHTWNGHKFHKKIVNKKSYPINLDTPD